MKEIIPKEVIEQKILLIRGHKVMLDNNLAELYGVETKVLLQAVKRNIERFPEDFMFQLIGDEFKILRSHFVTSSWGGRRYLFEIPNWNIKKRYKTIFEAIRQLMAPPEKPHRQIGFRIEKDK